MLSTGLGVQRIESRFNGFLGLAKPLPRDSVLEVEISGKACSAREGGGITRFSGFVKSGLDEGKVSDCLLSRIPIELRIRQVHRN